MISQHQINSPDFFLSPSLSRSHLLQFYLTSYFTFIFVRHWLDSLAHSQWETLINSSLCKGINESFVFTYKLHKQAHMNEIKKNNVYKNDQRLCVPLRSPPSSSPPSTSISYIYKNINSDIITPLLPTSIHLSISGHILLL